MPVGNARNGNAVRVRTIVTPQQTPMGGIFGESKLSRFNEVITVWELVCRGASSEFAPSLPYLIALNS